MKYCISFILLALLGAVNALPAQELLKNPHFAETGDGKLATGWFNDSVRLEAGPEFAAATVDGQLAQQMSATDGNPQTRWASMEQESWLEVDLGKPMTFSKAMISEAFSPRVQSFELQAKVGNAWKTFHKGATLSENAVASFAPVTAQNVRLNILQASDGPTIWEFQLMQK